MVSKVAVVDLNQDAVQSLRQALTLIGGINDLNVQKRNAVVKVGVFDPTSKHHSSVDVVGAIVKSFCRAPTVYLAESDNYRGTGSDRLQIWKNLFSQRVVPFNLSSDKDRRQVKIIGESVGLSHILFKPNTLVSTHILRTFEKGSVLKNLFGLIPDKNKAKYHHLTKSRGLGLEQAIMDVYEAVGGVDLAVLDGTRITLGVMPDSPTVDANILVVGRDAIAVEAVGFAALGYDPENVPVIKEAMNRGLGEGNLDKIQILGTPIEQLKDRFIPLLSTARRSKRSSVKKKSSAKKEN
jgi:uncharacterized protein (DUF362 family)